MSEEFCTIEYKPRDLKSEAMQKLFKNLDLHNVTVGIHRAEGEKVIAVSNNKPFTMIENACIQEFGNTQTVQKTRRFKSPITGKWFYLKKGTKITIPPRPFVRVFTYDKKLKKELTGAFKNSIEKYDNPQDIYENVGDYARLTMKGRFLDGSIKPKNRPMTIQYKGYNDPLVLTGEMAKSIKSEVH